MVASAARDDAYANLDLPEEYVLRRGCTASQAKPQLGPPPRVMLYGAETTGTAAYFIRALRI